MAMSNIDPFAYTSKVMQLTTRPGALLVVGDGQDKANVMAIGWCHLGVIWNQPVCVVYVRPSRYSYTFLEKWGQFTFNLLPPAMQDKVLLCGSRSGRDGDKFTAAGLTKQPAEKVKVPVIKEAIWQCECEVIHHNDIIAGNLQQEVIGRFYQQGDFHRCYYGLLVSCRGDREAIQAI